MILNNFWKCMKALHCSTDISFLNIIQANGEVQKGFYFSKQVFAPFNLNGVSLLLDEKTSYYTAGTHRIGFGTGTTAVTEDDYKLENIITSGIELASTNTASTTVTEEDGVLKKIINYSAVYKNTSGDTLTISEMGLYSGLAYGTSGYYYPTLIYRHVFDEPIVVEASNTFTIEFSGEMDMSF